MDFQEEELNEIINIFKTESEEIIDRLNNNLLELEKDTDNKDLIVLLFRDTHSIKGAARMTGFSNVQKIAHSMEDILSLAKEDSLKLTSKIADVMYQSVDLMSKIINQSLDKGKEYCSETEVQKQIEMLENLQKNDADVKQYEDIENLTENKNNILKDNYDKINSLVVNLLIDINKISENFDKNLVLKLLKNTTELYNYFEKINHFNIKNELETINLKLDIVAKFNSILTQEEIDEIKKRVDNIIEEINVLYKNNSLDIIDYYQNTTFSEQCANKNIIEAEQIKCNFANIKEKIKTLTFSTDKITEIVFELKNLKEIFKEEKSVFLLDKAIDLLEFINKSNIIPDESQTEIITNALEYCYDCINNIDSSENVELLEQQLTVAKQLIEISKSSDEVTNPYAREFLEDIKNYSKVLKSSEIKTLHVDSSKLDIMANQIGELISTKIKSTKQINELSLLKKEIEECYKGYVKIIKNLKSANKEKKHSNDINKDIFSNIYSKQITDTLLKQNKILNDIVNKYDIHLRSCSEIDVKLTKLTEDFDSMIKNIRVLPLATIFHMFGRMVRDIANERGKKVELTINGSETSVDKKIIEEIKNPLIHIIRNSIDHGIEPPDIRKEKGKSPVGHIEINAKLEDNTVFIAIKDDGQGFNIKKIKDKAIQKGFLTEEELSNLDEEEIINLVFLPGFTTGDEITSISGRGVGMDIVKSKIAELNGTVKVISEYNKGCVIQIKIPIKVATLSVFLLKVSEQIFAIPVSIVNSVVLKKDDDIIKNNNLMTIVHNEKSIPVYYCSELLNLENHNNLSKYKTIVIIETNNKKFGLIADKLLGEQEILHKNFSPPFKKIKNFSGLTTLDSGEICLVLNVLELLESMPFISTKLEKLDKNRLIDKKTKAQDKTILLVDDSVTSITYGKNILENYGYIVKIAKNPIEAFKILKQSRIDLIISDYEMPNMNGLEFLSSIKANEMYSDIPFIMMSSLTDEKIKHQAEEFGAIKYIIKGDFDKNALVNMISEILLK